MPLMTRKPDDYTLHAVLLVILIAVISSSCTRSRYTTIYYNAYSPLYDEFFVIASDHKLDSNSVVWFDDHAQVVNYCTPYVAKIISPYNK